MTTGIINTEYQLTDRFDRDEGQVYLSGTDALLRLLMMQRRRDQNAGLETAGYVSGYPGSPLGTFDSLLRSSSELLARNQITFVPGLNEDLAATAVWGTQFLNLGPVSSRYAGVFGLWYGKGPGVERSTDAIRTASYHGVAAHGGVLALAGDDHDPRSTVTAQQSDTLFVHMLIPVFSPATIQDYLDFGLAGWALSRHSSLWVAMICLNDTIDSGATVQLDPDRPTLIVPPDSGVRYRIGASRSKTELEEDILGTRHPAAQAFVKANGLDRVAFGSSKPRLAIVTAGRAYLDVVDALAGLGMSSERAVTTGIGVYKLAMTWPLEPTGVDNFVRGAEEVVVVEPKYPIIEDQVSRILRTMPRAERPELVGKRDDTGATLIPQTGALNASLISRALLARIRKVCPDAELSAPRERFSVRLTPAAPASDLKRAPGFCPGCPHNTSTRIPDGSVAIGGTGCHGMAIALAAPDRQTTFFSHMGGEGALWVGMAPFADERHIFQNLGDGTYSHSGSLSIRAAIAAKVNLTFKILLNGSIAMTGGQEIAGGGLTAAEIARQVLAEGATKVVVVTEDPDRVSTRGLPDGVKVHRREKLLQIEDELRLVSGVSVLIYDQECAADLRRRRKRREAAEPDQRVFIHETVCEGCGDCNVQSNCISVEPHETEFGRKRKIEQSSCNKDYSCLNGYCPSFVTLRGAKVRRAERGTGLAAARDGLTPPTASALADPYNIIVGGIGGSGVLTIGAVLGMAAHLEGKTASVLNETGMAQKNGTVQSHVRISAQAGELSPRVGERSADLVLGADIVVASSSGVLSRVDPERTTAVINTAVRPTVAFSGNTHLDLSPDRMVAALTAATGGQASFVDASRLAEAALGDMTYMNVFLLGYAFQRGRIPLSSESIERAMELNGLAVDANKEAFRWGRLTAHDEGAVRARLGQAPENAARAQPLHELIRTRHDFLVRYQNAAYASRYEATVRRVEQVEGDRVHGHDELTRAVAATLFQLMAYKDEYEVARLYSDPAFTERLDREFEDRGRMKVHLAPQILNRRDRRSGRAAKIAVPASVALPLFKVLQHGKRVRGTPLDLLGRTPHRRAERARIKEYEALLDELLATLDASNHALAVQLAAAPQEIRGYDTVKDAAAVAVQEKIDMLFGEYRASSTSPEASA